MADFSGIRTCVFDAYGTLFDVHSAVARHRQRLGPAADRVSALWRRKQLEYTWLRSLMGRHADFRQVTAESLAYAFAVFRIHDPALRDDLLAAYEVLDCYPEVAAVLGDLRSRGVVTAVLSNGSPEMLQAATRAGGIEALLDHVLSVEEVGIYKPAPVVYQLAIDRLGIPADCISFQSSNAWDIAGAASFGYRTVWINRPNDEPERLPDGADAVLSNLIGLPAVLGLGA